MLLELFAEMLEQRLVVHIADAVARLVHDGDDALVRLLDQVAYNFVVEVVNVEPVNVLALVLLLLLLQHELDEELLQLFVAVINAELFKTFAIKIVPYDLSII